MIISKPCVTHHLLDTANRLPVNTVISELLQSDEPVTVSVDSVEHRRYELVKMGESCVGVTVTVLTQFDMI